MSIDLAQRFNQQRVPSIVGIVWETCSANFCKIHLCGNDHSLDKKAASQMLAKVAINLEDSDAGHTSESDVLTNVFGAHALTC